MSLEILPLLTNVCMDGGENVPSYTVGGNVNLVQPLWKTVQRLFKRLKLELRYDSAIPLLGIYP
jgi:hypothetical protein